MAETDSEPKTKTDVYRDRNLLAVAFLAAYAERAHFANEPAEMGWWPDTDDVNGEEWAVVWVDLPTGQVGWHIRREQVPEWLEKRDPNYDGYSTETKNARLARFADISEVGDASTTDFSTDSLSGTVAGDEDLEALAGQFGRSLVEAMREVHDGDLEACDVAVDVEVRPAEEA